MVLDRLKSFLPDLIFWITTVIYRNYKNQDINFLRKTYFFGMNGWMIGHLISYFLKVINLD